MNRHKVQMYKIKQLKIDEKKLQDLKEIEEGLPCHLRDLFKRSLKNRVHRDCMVVGFVLNTTLCDKVCL